MAVIKRRSVSRFPPRRSRHALAPAAAIITLLLLWTFSSHSSPRLSESRIGRFPSTIDSFLNETTRLAEYFTAYPLNESEFGQMGKRVQILQDWIKASETLPLEAEQVDTLSRNTESLALSLFPFLNSPSKTGNWSRPRSLRSSFAPGSKGLVIAVGKRGFRYACHLIANLRQVLKSTLPIQVAYAGDEDLPPDYRQYLVSMDSQITALDVTTVFDGTMLDLSNGGWAIKPFALLASSFEKVMVLDADVIFLQKPEKILESDPRFQATGTLLFHDRLIWSNQGRHEWWETVLAHTHLSSNIRNSRAYVGGYAEEGESGLVAMDKSRLGVLMGLLHICWQNTPAVRDKYTYRFGYGEKESYWFGFELAAVPYSMEEHYAAMLGHRVTDDGSEKVCSFVIAHVDHAGKLLWYNGSLLKNKSQNSTDFDVPTVWMIDGTWEKDGGDASLLSCMQGAKIQPVSNKEAELLERTVEAAKRVDEDLIHQFPEII